MNIQKLLPLVLAVGFNMGMLATSAQAAVNTDNLMVYKFQQTEMATLDTTASYMKQFLPAESTDGVRVDDTDIVRYVSAKDTNTTFEHNLATGDLSFHRNFSRYLGDFVPKLPVGDEAVKIAASFLEKNKLLPSNRDELKVDHIGGLRATSVLSSGRPGPVVDKLTTITFGRQLNGIPVIGAGSKMIIDIGDSGEIISATKRWRELEKPTSLSAKEIISEATALELAKRQIMSEFGEKSAIEIVQTQIAYFDNNGSAIQPVFAFQAKIQLENRELPPVEYVTVVPAMIKPIEALNLTQVDEEAVKLIESNGSTIPTEAGKGGD